jgi:diaminopimelate epimerase
MKKINFTKMAGAGNDFIIIEARKGLDVKQLALKACDRTNGIGADGVLILDRSQKADYRMRVINADSSEAEMCGNGARCMAAYIARHLKPKKKLFSMETLAGTVLGKAAGEVATVRLSDPSGYRPEVTIDLNGRPLRVSFIDTGVPHTVVFVDALDTIEVDTIGRAVRHHPAFQPKGTNVNFVEQVDAGLVRARTYERGVEDETKACGTGSVAAAIVTYLKANPEIKDAAKAQMKVRTAGKEILEVTFDLAGGQVSNVWLKGSARFIAAGEYYFSG